MVSNINLPKEQKNYVLENVEIFTRYLRYIEEVDILAEEKLEDMLFLLNNII